MGLTYWNPDAPVSVGEEVGRACEACPNRQALLVLAGAKKSESVYGCPRCGWPLLPETYKAGLERYAALGQAIVPELWK